MTHAATIKMKAVEKQAKEAKVLTQKLAPPEKKPRKLKLLNAVIYTTFILLFIFMVVVGYWSFYPYKTADIVEPINILNTNHEIAPGEKIVMELHITKYNLYPLTGDNNILCDNGRIYNITKINPAGANSLALGDYVRIQGAYSLPGDAEVGTICHFEFQNFYKVNPIRTIPKTWKSENFKVAS